MLMRLAAAALAGVAVGVGFPPYSLTWLVPVGLTALAVLVAGQRPRGGFLLGLAFGLGFMLVLLPWLRVVSPLAWPALSVVEALYLGLLGWAWVLLRRLPWAPVWQAATWVAVELVRGAFPLGGFPWGRLAHVMVDTPLAPLVRYAGDGGAAFVLVLLTCLVGTALAAGGPARRRLAPVGLAVALGVAVGALPDVPRVPAGETGTVRVALVQGNTAGTGLAAMAERRAVLENHVEATFGLADRIAAGTAERPDLMVWPENSSDIDPSTDAAAHAAIAAAVEAVGVPTLMGAVVENPDGPGWFNRALVWSAQGTIGQHYDKQHAVPFGEYIPARALFAPLIPALDQIPEDMVPGTRPGLLDVGPARTGVLMCFEVGYESQVRTLVRGGAGVIVVPTNNATYMGTGQVEQQFEISRTVALETGRYVLVAATDGISGIIAPDGSVAARAPVRRSVVLDREITLGGALTPAVRFGSAIDGGLWLLTLIPLVTAAWLTYRRSFRRRQAFRRRQRQPEEKEPAA